jgi:hypothetical protein
MLDPSHVNKEGAVRIECSENMIAATRPKVSKPRLRPENYSKTGRKQAETFIKP